MKKKNIYGQSIDYEPRTKNFWADQILVWRFSTKGWGKTVAIQMNIMRTDFEEIKKITKKHLGVVKGFVWEPSACEVMNIIRP